MNLNQPHSLNHDMPGTFFAAREQAGPLTPLEQCYRAICTLGFSGLIRCDAVMGQAEPTPQGHRWLVPVLHQTLQHTGPMPLSALDWIAIYHRARDMALRHFSDWNARVALNAPNRNALPGSRPFPSGRHKSAPCHLIRPALFANHYKGDLQ